MTQIYKQEHSNILWYTSFSTAITGVHALFWLQRMDIGILLILVWLTSINYWRRPVKGLRRTLDMMAVAISVPYSCYTALDSEYRYLYYTFVSFGTHWYILSNALLKHDPLKSVICHALVHISFAVGYFVMVAGL